MEKYEKIVPVRIKKGITFDLEIKFVLVVLLEAPKTSEDYVYKLRNSNFTLKGTPFNTAGWTSVEIAGKMIEKIGPILATKY